MGRRSPTDDEYLSSKYVPYVRLDTPAAAREFLPAGPGKALTLELVRQFTKTAKRDPETAMTVLGILRAHSINGAEAPLAAAALMFAAIAVLASTTFDIDAPWSWVIAIALAVVVVGSATTIIHMSLAAHARRVVATTWLAAYEDALAKRVK